MVSPPGGLTMHTVDAGQPIGKPSEAVALAEVRAAASVVADLHEQQLTGCADGDRAVLAPDKLIPCESEIIK